MNEIGILLIVAALGGFVSGLIAQSKGHGFGGYFVLGFLVPIIGIIVALAARPAVKSAWWADPTGRFEYRYYDGRQWTSNVAREGKKYQDAI